MNRKQNVLFTLLGIALAILMVQSVRYMDWEELGHLLRDPAHWWFEILGEIASSIAAYPFIRFVVNRWMQRHDRKAHASRCVTEPHYQTEEV